MILLSLMDNYFMKSTITVRSFAKAIDFYDIYINIIIVHLLLVPNLWFLTKRVSNNEKVHIYHCNIILLNDPFIVTT